MGHIVYLTKISKETTQGLFEGNNDIPLFWLALMDIESIEKIEEKWRLALNSEEFSEDTTICIPKERCLLNAQKAEKYIEKNLPDKLKLYNDFRNYVNQTLDESDILEFSIIEIANFDGIEKFISYLKREISMIRNGNKTRRKLNSDDFCLVGYDRFICDKFQGHSDDYFARCQKEENDRKEREAIKRKNDRKKKINKIGERIFMIFCSLILIFYGILGIIYEKFHISSVLWIILGAIIFYFWGLRKK